MVKNTTTNLVSALRQKMLVFIALACISLSATASITVSTSRNPVALDDSFHLIYEADSSVMMTRISRRYIFTLMY